MKFWICLLLLPAFAHEECEEAAMLQKNQEQLRKIAARGKTSKAIPAFMATIGLQMCEATLNTACSKIEEVIVRGSQTIANLKEKDPATVTKVFGQIFASMNTELKKGCDEVKLGLGVQGLTTSLDKLQASMDTATAQINEMKSTCAFKEGSLSEYTACRKATKASSAVMTKTFGTWMSGTGDELVKNVLPWDQSQMRDFNKKKIPEVTEIVSKMCSTLQDFVDSITGDMEKTEKQKEAKAAKAPA